MKRMNNIKKITSVLLALVMLFSMGMLVSADEPVVNLGEKDLEDSYNGSINIYKYDISAWEKAINEELAAELAADFTIKYYGNKASGKALNPDEQVGYYYLNAADEQAGEADDASEEAIAKRQPVYLNELDSISNITFRIQSAVPKSGKEGSTLVTDYTVNNIIDSYGKTQNGIMKWVGVPRGYYIITEEANETTAGVISPFVISVPMVDPANIESPVEIKDIHIYPKNKLKDGPEIEKDFEYNYENGNVITWTIKADVPEDIKTSQKYIITDKMSSGLDYVGDEEDLQVYYIANPDDDPADWVKVNLEYDVDYEVELSTNSSGVTTLIVSFTEEGRTALDAAAGETLYVVYDTVINLTDEEWDELEAGAINNEVILDFTNEDGNDYKNEPDPVPVDDFSGIEIIKKDGATDAKLKGVTFKIYTKLNEAGTDVDTASVLKDKDGEEIVLITDENGFAYYYGLSEGEYYLVETATLGGYKLLTGYKTVKITKALVENNTAFTAEILNYLDNGITLPQTGGMGTFLFTVIGIVLLAAAGFVFIIARKRRVVK